MPDSKPSAAPLQQAANRGRGELARVFTRAHRWVAAAWMSGTLLLGLVSWLWQPASLDAVLLISLASAAIAHLALLPGSLIGRIAVFEPLAADSGSEGQVQASLLAVIAAMTIRLAGTVALIVWCKYQMAETMALIIGTSLFWYFALTSLEVVLLAKSFARLDRPVATLTPPDRHHATTLR